MEPVLLIGVKKPQEKSWEIDDYLDELKLLAENVGFRGRERLVQRRDKPDKTTFVGQGMVERIHQTVINESLVAVIFDDELSPSQQRNLENQLPVPVYDRTFIILSIFAERAKTKEARTQVELAQLKYEYPRLKKMWSHLHRQMGAVGGRGGEGEKQLEIDRRIGRERMIKLERALKRFETGRSERKKQRRSLLNIALVGYTNVGKSTLMNQLTKSRVEADDRLFVTLDATSRLWTIDPVLKVILSDTVGFIRKLPHDLIASFRSTLSEVRDADLLFHVIDACHPHLNDLMKTVDDVIGSLADASVPSVLVFNKIDGLTGLELKSLKRAYPDGLFVSALNKEGLEDLRACVLHRFAERIQVVRFVLPPTRLGMFYRIGEYGQIRNSRHEDDGIHLEIRGLRERIEALQRDLPYLVVQPADSGKDAASGPCATS